MPNETNGNVRRGGRIVDLTATRAKRTAWWGGALSTRRPVASVTSPENGAWKPKLATFDRELAIMESVERHNAECRAKRGIARATRRSRRTLPLLLIVVAAGLVAAVIVGSWITTTSQSVQSVVLSIPTGSQPPATVRAGTAFSFNVSAIANPTTVVFNNVYLIVQALDSATPLTCAQVFGGAMISLSEQPGTTGGFSALLAYSDTAGTLCTSGGAQAAYFYWILGGTPQLTQQVNGVAATYQFHGTWSAPPSTGSGAFKIAPAQ